MFRFRRSPPRKRMLIVRLTDEQYGFVTNEAQRRGVSISDLLRQLLEDGVGVAEATPRQRRAEALGKE